MSDHQPREKAAAEHPELRTVRITFIGQSSLSVSECPPGFCERVVDDLLDIMRGANPDPIYLINRPHHGPQYFDARKVVSVEVLGGPGVGRWSLEEAT